MNQLIIEPATFEDLPAIHGLVRELAIYENAEHEFTATLEAYEADFLDGIFDAIVARQHEEVVGMVLYYITYSTWKGRMMYLEDFVVKESFRRKGIGELLFKAFLTEAETNGCKLAKWQVLDWNKPAIDFYKKHQAIIEKGWWNGKFFFDT